MDSDTNYWLKQDPKAPLYKDLIWSRPENKSQAGKLLIVGGNANSFSEVNTAIIEAEKAGIGRTTLFLPNSLQKTLSKIINNAEYGPTTVSGGFSREALGQLISLANWADGVLIAGDLGKNAETAILLESFMDKYRGILVLANDTIALIASQPLTMLKRPSSILVLSLSQLQKFAKEIKFTQAFTSTMDLTSLVRTLHDFSVEYESAILLYHEKIIVFAHKGKVSTTNKFVPANWPSELAAKSSVWYIQNPNNIFEAVTSSFI